MIMEKNSIGEIVEEGEVSLWKETQYFYNEQYDKTTKSPKHVENCLSW